MQSKSIYVLIVAAVVLIGGAGAFLINDVAPKQEQITKAIKYEDIK